MKRDFHKYLDRLPDYLAIKGIEIKDYKCRCISPLHEDKNPSCHVDKKYFHCLSCGISGDIYDAVMLLENMPPSPKKHFEFLETFFSRHYKCSCCGGFFENRCSDEEAEAERQKNFPGVPLSECELVCDDCYKKIMKEVK
jgi:Fe2+ or Zn2+ uptake regulation protein